MGNAMKTTKIYRTIDCYALDQVAEDAGVCGFQLMENAGNGMGRIIMARFAPKNACIVCGPGANGGDGYVVAKYLFEQGCAVSLLSLSPPNPNTVAAQMEARLPAGVQREVKTIPTDCEIIIDCMFGAGLDRPIIARPAVLIEQVNAHPAPVIAADLPSGINGDRAQPGTPSIIAAMTITFEVLKLAHVLEPARSQCGEIVVIDIGFPAGTIDQVEPIAVQNHPSLWPQIPVIPDMLSHKHNRGRLLVDCGGPLQSGAARLAARAGLRIGAGWVTLCGTEDAMQVCANHETSIVLSVRQQGEPIAEVMRSQTPDCVLLGPAGGVGEAMKRQVLDLLQTGTATVLDADALTSFAEHPQDLLEACHAKTVLLPHEGEFRRLFADLTTKTGNKISRVKAAAQRAGCTVLLKGADSVMADADGRVVVNTHTSSWLATLGTGDVLAGMVAGLMAQGQGGFDALCAAVWLHGELGRQLGAGLIAEDLPGAIPAMLQQFRGD
ncbi:MAG: bifunctional ADP-dependent NAD(P)H-hydrate dehydratase/NAD(P)H-hydrate epimerase [Robiginitomaculum sp.]|nr:MAG: bifunctional ADP-dependent NAD(P)H-hydrate dehydratase/NAD(P)H-hydrate epimerase [Robiginitomaculum sp.]